MKTKLYDFIEYLLEWKRKIKRLSISRDELFNLMINCGIFSRNTQLMYEKVLKQYGGIKEIPDGYELDSVQLLEIEEFQNKSDNDTSKTGVVPEDKQFKNPTEGA